VDLAPLYKLVLLNLGLKLCNFHEVVMNAVYFARPWVPSGRGHTEAEGRVSERMNEGSLASAGGANDDKRFEFWSRFSFEVFLIQLYGLGGRHHGFDPISVHEFAYLA